MSQSAATFFGFWEGVRGSQYQNRLPDGEPGLIGGGSAPAGPIANGPAGPVVPGGGLFSPRTGFTPIQFPPCSDDVGRPEVGLSGSAEDCYQTCAREGYSNSEYLTCLFNCYNGDWGVRENRACPGDSQSAFPLPAFQDVYPITQDCFLLQHGIRDWPATSCCPPPLNATNDCSPPTYEEYAAMVLAVPCREWQFRDGKPLVRPRQATSVDQQLFGAGVAILLKNLDVVLWLVCLIQNWSPEFNGLKRLDASRLILELMTVDENGRFPWTVTYVNNSSAGGAHMWAFTYIDRGNHRSVGLVMPVEGSTWIKRSQQWSRGGTEAFCAAVQVASEILHELIHIVGDGFNSGDAGADDPLYPTDGIHGFDPMHNINEIGAWHESYKDPHTLMDESYKFPCWDEARLAGTMFLWAMSKRYTCLATSGNCCVNREKPEFFAYSTSSMLQVSASC